jgi:hypothetical protein
VGASKRVEYYPNFEERKAAAFNQSHPMEYNYYTPSIESRSGGGDTQVEEAANANLLDKSAFGNEVVIKENIYQDIKVNGPKWSNDGG